MVPPVIVPSTVPTATVVVGPVNGPVRPNPPGVAKPCVPFLWPAFANNAPVNFRTGGPQGIYLWYAAGLFYVRFYNPVLVPIVFTGSVAANANISTTGQYLERYDDVLRKGRKSASFRFHTTYDLDGFTVKASCATAITFRFSLNGVPVGPQQIFIGRNGGNPTNIPVTFIR